jgi:4-diphosphocytidyl-2-C-methyl-D-erythritol kinase
VETPFKLSTQTLAAVAADLGSDCPVFFQEGAAVMRGRGERITPLPASALRRIRGRRVLVFKPDFAIATAWSYARLAAAAPGSYLEAAEAEERLAVWIEHPDTPAEALLFNNMEAPAFAKFLALPVLCQQLETRFGLKPRMSGSGSACFAFLANDTDTSPMVAAIREAWGQSAFVVEATLT